MTERHEATFVCHGETFRLMPEKAIYWESERALIVADLHLGKAATFRAAALAVPESTTWDTLERLDRCIALTNPQRLVVLGDVVHARRGMTETLIHTVCAWRERHPRLTMQVITGNHDRHAGALPQAWCMENLTELHHHPPFVLRHHPDAVPGAYVLAGHIHPAVRLYPHGRGSLRLPCFSFGKHAAVLPAFGAFTGMADIEPLKTDKTFVIAANEVLEVTGMAGGLPRA